MSLQEVQLRVVFGLQVYLLCLYLQVFYSRVQVPVQDSLSAPRHARAAPLA